jgi:hypothetical protein
MKILRNGTTELLHSQSNRPRRGAKTSEKTGESINSDVSAADGKEQNANWNDEPHLLLPAPDITMSGFKRLATRRVPRRCRGYKITAAREPGDVSQLSGTLNAVKCEAKMGDVIQGPWKKRTGFEKRTVLELIEHELLILQNLDKREEPTALQPPRWPNVRAMSASSASAARGEPSRS